MVPLILSAPDLPAGRFTGVTRSIDVFPTLAALSGIPLPPDATMGVDLSAALRGAAPAPELLAFSHTGLPLAFGSSTLFPSIVKRFPEFDPRVLWVAVREGGLAYKLVSDNGTTFEPRVYDWESDPEETTDLHDPANEHHAAMVTRLEQYKAALAAVHDRWRAVAEGRLPTERQESLLRSLGYIQ
jgi:arylsulfatase A-like enzyme